MTTSKARSLGFLGARYRRDAVRQFLAEWANIQTDYFAGLPEGAKPDPAVIRRIDAGIRRLISRYPEIFSRLPGPPSPPPPDAESTITSTEWEFAARVQDYLRRAWEAPDLRSREWFIFKAREKYHDSTLVRPIFEKRVQLAAAQGSNEVRFTHEEEEIRQGPPHMSEFEHVMYQFQRMASQARRCPNPECPAPFFFALRKNQKYCSETCASIALREQKREWWRRNYGNE